MCAADKKCAPLVNKQLAFSFYPSTHGRMKTAKKVVSLDMSGETKAPYFFVSLHFSACFSSLSAHGRAVAAVRKLAAGWAISSQREHTWRLKMVAA